MQLGLSPFNFTIFICSDLSGTNCCSMSNDTLHILKQSQTWKRSNYEQRDTLQTTDMNFEFSVLNKQSVKNKKWTNSRSKKEL